MQERKNVKLKKKKKIEKIGVLDKFKYFVVVM